MTQPLIVAVWEPWGLYCNAVTDDPDRLAAQSMTLNQARDYVRRAPAPHRPAVIPSFTHLAQRYVAAGITSPQPLAVYRLISRGGRGSGDQGRPRGRWHRFTFTPTAS